MTEATTTFDAQMIALMATHRLQSISVTLIRASDGVGMFWVSCAQADGLGAQGGIDRETGAADAIQSAINELNAKRVTLADVPARLLDRPA